MGRGYKPRFSNTLINVGLIPPSRTEREVAVPLATLVRVGGLAAVLAGVLLVLAELLNLTLDFDTDPVEAATSVTSVIQSVVLMLVVALLLVGLVGLYIRVAEATGRFGLVGFLVALVGTGMVMGVLWDQTFTVPALAQDAPTLLETAPRPW